MDITENIAYRAFRAEDATSYSASARSKFPTRKTIINGQKRFFKTLMLLVLLLRVIIVQAQDYSFSIQTSNGQTLFFNILNGSQVQLTHESNYSPFYSNKPSGELQIPSSVVHEGATYSVVSIGEKSFWGCDNLVTVTIPNSVTTIGADAFVGCKSLTSVSLPSSITTIANGTFMGCHSLASIAIPQGVTSIGEDAFSNCVGLVSVSIPSSVNSIGRYAFRNCSSLSSITIPPSVTTLQEEVFYYCTSLSAITLPSTITTIGVRAFAGCRNLESIALPAGLVTIGNEAFSYCTEIMTITIPNTVTNIGNKAFLCCSKLSGINIGTNVTSIGSEAFTECHSLQSIVIPNSVTNIGMRAFKFCSRLERVTLSNSLTQINNDLFAYCGNLDSVEIHSGVTKIGTNAFLGCRGLSAVTLPATLNEIGSAAFQSCEMLESITIPNSVTQIGTGAFSYCYSLKSVILPNALNQINANTFEYCSNLQYVFLPSSITAIDNKAFANCGKLSCVTIAGNVSSIGSNAFQGVNRIRYNGTAAGSPWGAGEIQNHWYYNNGFYYTSSAMDTLTGADITIDTLVIPTSVNTIGVYALAHHTDLVSVTIPNSVTAIGTSAFAYCYSLSPVTIPNNVASIASNAFTDVTMIYYQGSVGGSFGARCRNGYEENGLYYTNSSKTSLIGANRDVTVANIPSSVLTIKAKAFYNHKLLETVTIPSSVGMILNSTFEGCTSLSSINIPSNVTALGSDCFKNCKSLTTITLPSALTQIVNNLFYNCSSLQSITIPNSVTNIGHSAFYGCSDLASVTFGNSLQSLGTQAFRYCRSLTSITLPATVSNTGEFVFANCSALESIALPESLTHMGRFMFQYCPSLTTVTGGSNIQTIGEYSFDGCIGLSTFHCFNALDSIGQYVFRGCSRLRRVEFNTALSAIGSNAFYRCASIDTLYFNERLKRIHNQVFTYCYGLKHIEMPDSLTTIGSDAFYGCSNLLKLDLADKLRAIDNSAFSECHALETITTGSSLNTINSSVFLNCKRLISVDLSPAVREIKSTAFYGCAKLPHIVIPDSVTTIESNAFTNNSSMRSAVIGVDVNFIGNQAFSTGNPLCVTFKRCTPASLGTQVFSNGSNFFVPQGCLSAYQGATGYTSLNIAERHQYSASVSGGHGTVQIIDTFGCSSTVTFVANAESGYHFAGWSDGSTDSIYTVTITQDTNLLASFISNASTPSGVPLPYCESFDSYPSGEGHMPTYWNGYNTLSMDLGRFPHVSSGRSHSPSNCFCMRAFSNNSCYAMLPNFNLDSIQQLNISFNVMKNDDEPGRLIMGVLTDTTSYNSFIPLDTIDIPLYNQWVPVQYSYRNYHGTAQRGCILDRRIYNSAGNLYIDDFVADTWERPRLERYNGTIVQATSNNADYWLEYGAQGFTPGSSSSTLLHVNQNPYILTGLDSSATYDFYAYPYNGPYLDRGNCSNPLAVVNIIQSSVTIVNDTSICDVISFTWKGHYFTASGEYRDTISTPLGYDSIFVTRVQMHSSSSTIDSVTGCNSFTWQNGITYNASTTTPQVVLNNMFGCDSIIHLHLTIYPQENNTLNVSACDSYTWDVTGQTYTTDTIVEAITQSGTCYDTTMLILMIRPSPTLTHIPDTIINQGTSVTLHASGANLFTWFDADGNVLSNSSDITLSPSTSTTYYFDAFNDGVNIIHNGDFELGNVGFNTSYHYSSNLYPEAYYYIGSNAHTYHAGFTGAHDHTSGSGKYMIVNGAGTAGVNVWSQTVSVSPHTEYAFSVWVCSVSPYPISLQALLQFSINGTQIGEPFRAPLNLNTWINFYEVWNSGENTTATISILNQNTASGGNDFGIDDMSFTDLISCRSHDSVRVLVGHHYDRTICSNQLPYTWNGVTFTRAGVASATLTGSHGQDSIVLMNLMVKPSLQAEAFDTICDNDLFLFNGTNLTSSGTYLDTLTAQNGCDSIVTLQLTVKNSSSGDTSAAACDSFTWHGTTYTAGGMPEYHLTNAAGCDSTATLHLTVNYSSQSNYSETIIENQLPYTFIGRLYTISDFHNYTLNDTITITNAVGCDSIIYYNLTFSPNKNTYLDSSVCDNEIPIIWDNIIFTEAVTKIDSLIASSGADSLVHRTLIVHSTYHWHDTATICENSFPYTWRDSTFAIGTESGDYTLSRSSIYGCDSIISINLTISPIYAYYDTAAICADATPYVWLDTSINISSTISTSQTNTYSLHRYTSNGCDSIRTLILSIHPLFDIHDSITICEKTLPLTWRDTTIAIGNHSGIFTRNYPSINLCDSTCTLHLTIDTNTSGIVHEYIVENDLPYTYHGVTMYGDTNGIDILLQNVHNCDSNVTYSLTVWRNTFSNIDSSICQNELPFHWNNITFTGDTTFYNPQQHTFNLSDTLTSHTGADSIVYMHLTIQSIYHTDEVQNLCRDALPYTWHDTLFSEGQNSGVFHRNYQSVFGCDSSFTLQLTINEIYNTIDSVQSCTPYTWINGITYTSPTTDPIFMLNSIAGCDSVIHLYFSYFEPVFTMLTDSLCAGSTYLFGDSELTSGGIYEDTLTAANLCDSIITLTLTQLTPPAIEITTRQDCQSLIHTIQASTTVDYIHWDVNEGTWNPNWGLQSNRQILVRTNKNITLTLTADYTGTETCPASKSITIAPIVQPMAQMKVTPEQLTFGSGNVNAIDLSSGATHHQWFVNSDDFGESHQINYTPNLDEDSIVIMLVATSLYCTDSTATTIRIFHTDIFAPNAFTPDENSNKEFRIFIEDYIDFDLYIYNRQGLLVFHTNDITNAWDGSHKGHPCVQDSYVWILKYTTKDMPKTPQVKKGTVLLLR